MSTFTRQVIFLTVYLISVCSVNAIKAESPVNVLMIAIDDLRPELGCYGNSKVVSPNIDSLAASGRLFQRAYCQQAVCNPSRTSLMTGLRPDSIGVTGNHIHFRSNHPNVVTLSQHFKQNGYHAQSIGKIYHGVFPDGASKTSWDTMGDPQSWSVPTTRFGPRYYYTESGIEQAKQSYLSSFRPKNPQPNDWTQKLVFGPMTEDPEVDDDTLYDGKVAAAAVQAIGNLKDSGQPFFLAVGFIKPHTPFVAPKRYWNLYDPEEIDLASRDSLPDGAPVYAGHGSGEIRRYTDQPNQGKIPEANRRRLKHGYYACISYIDAQVGKVLNALKENGLEKNTIVVLFGDHGYHLGEHGLWGKTTNFELDTRVPLIIRTPSMQEPGIATSSLAELVDLYPTLAELAGLAVSDELEGTSLTAELESPDASSSDVAISQYPRGKMMGYSLRTNHWRYTEWIERNSKRIVDRELYDHHQQKPIETENLINDSRFVAEIKDLSARLHQEIGISFSKQKPTTTSSKSNTSFEECPTGAFTEVATAIGKLTAEKGHAEIDPAHRYSGKQCLHILGGEKRTVELTLNQQKAGSSLTFQTERWTRRSPFEFRIQQLTDGKKWTEIYNGDGVIKIGGFLTKVTVPVGEKVTKLRFICTSPSSSGILIDDLSLVPPTPQKILGVTVEDVEVPVLIGLTQNPLLKIRIDVEGTLNPISVSEIQSSLFGSDLPADIQSVACYASGDSPNLTKVTTKFGEDSKGDLASKQFTGEIQLQHGANYFWLSCELNSTANIDHTLRAICKSVKFSNGKEVTLANDKIIHRLGVAVRNGGDDGVHTYRIPGLATTNNGTLIGVYDIRNTTGGDLPGDIDVGMSRSVDGGRTWETMQNIMDMGDDPDWRYDGIGDPAVLVDQKTGTIWVAATWSHGNRSWTGSGPGLEPEETGQFMLVKSDDDGVTWSKPINITKQVKDPKWSFILQGPGKGITMRDGTIVFAAQYQDSPEDRRLPHSTIIYSKDHGENWHVGTGAFDDTTEAQVVEIEPGVLMLNCRYNRKSVRVVMITKDMGKTWEKHSTSERALIEPRSCMASIINVDQELGKDVGGWLLFSNPDSLSGRNHITIKGSNDHGTTWPKEHRLLLDEGSGRGYSCMSMIDDETVGILYEGSRAHMTFQRVKLSAIQGKVKNEVSKTEQPTTLTLPQVFSDHMVLQADAELPVWGTAKPGAEVTVSLGNQLQTTIANKSGNWQTRFPARQASFVPTSLSVESGNSRIELKDVLFGQVWICAGQSNMEWKLSQASTAKEELANAANQKHLRLLHLQGGATGSSGTYTEKHLARLTPESYCEGKWQVASPESAKDFSAVAWHFGRRLQQELKVPVGLICPAVGGTPAEAWISREALESDPNFKDFVSGHWLDNPRLGEFCKTRGQQNLLAAMQSGETIPGDHLGPNHSFKTGFMWRAGIEPIIPFAIKGVVWYQGESNAESMARTKEHQQLFTLLINQWRADWNQGEFPFIFVQLPAINREFWPWFREGQRQVAQQLNNVGMAITIDTGHPSNVHPTDKETVGNRLAIWALGNTYNQEMVPSGPLVQQAVKKNESIQLTFDHAEKGLQSSDGEPLRHFEICGNDGIFYPATAQIAKDNLLSISSSHVKQPQHVRYAWAPYPEPSVNLTNSENLPASPFTTESAEELYETTLIKGKDQRPNILLIVGEDHGCELSCYGDPVITTPHIDQLAAEGVLFEKGYVTQSVCSPSRSTIFTGLYPHQNGQLGLATHNYGWFKKWPTSYSLLKGAGYRTGLIGKTHVNPADAVELHVDFRYQPSSNFAKKQVAQYAVEAGKFFRESDRPFFMTVNYPDAHWPLQGQVGGLPETQVEADKVQVMPYVGDANPRLKKVVQNYYDCMLRLDACVGQLLKQLKDSGKSENTLVIFIGDHGAQMARGKVTVYEGGMRVPFIVKWPDHTKAGLRSKALVSTIDLLPTFLDVAGIQSPSGLPGKTIRPILTKQSTDFREYLACERNCDAAHLTFPQRTIRDSRFKLIYSPVHDREDPAARYYRIHGASHWAGSLTDQELLGASKQTQAGYARWLNPPLYQLYDLNSDPNEWNDLANTPEFKEQKQRLITALKDWQKETADPIVDPEKLKQLMDENDAVDKEKRRSPASGWKYLEYWHPDKLSKAAPSTN
ncbi:MAG: hypothetical protein COA78_21720 [Blastopirellula sp.]|nr:MAG: hypothetical protein COA78_21720 [Blastopirellula sp.]